MTDYTFPLTGDLALVANFTQSAPLIITMPATKVQNVSANLQRQRESQWSTTTAYFQYGIDTNYGTTTESLLIPSGSYAVVPMNAKSPGLQTNTVYHYQAVVVVGGVSYFCDASACAGVTGMC